ncbi:MAG: hemerythrin domain-containing protein [Myxococcales bacterium]|jgi:iron-sulfur cluster repair protein YtfE (RIC family)|nr:hemerythrin domain-containing protein [Myxococcales bacterium]
MAERAWVTVPDRSVTEYLALDHDRLDTLLAEVIRLMAARRFVEGRPRLAEFALELRRHMRREEEIAFPRYEQLHGITDGLTRIMRDEHHIVEHYLVRMGEAAARDDRDGFESEQEAMAEVLRGHTAREEAMIYPLIDRALSPADREALVHAMRAHA